MDGTKVFINPAVLEKIEAGRPEYVSRIAWVNQMLEQAAEDRLQKLQAARDWLARAKPPCAGEVNG